MKRDLILGVAIMTILALAGCSTADKSLGHTVARVSLPSGAVIDWDNSKNLDVVFGVDPSSGLLSFSLKTATPESAMANVAANNAETAAALRDLAAMLKEMIPAAARAGAMTGS